MSITTLMILLLFSMHICSSDYSAIAMKTCVYISFIEESRVHNVNTTSMQQTLSSKNGMCTRDAPIPDTYIGIGHFWRYRVSIGYSVSIRYHNRYYYDVI